MHAKGSIIIVRDLKFSDIVPNTIMIIIKIKERNAKIYPITQISNPYPLNTSEWLKSSMASSLPVENLRPQNAGSIINYLQ